VDLLESISRLMPELLSPDQLAAAMTIRELIAVHRDHEDLISIGAYQRGSNPQVDAAIALMPEIDGFLRQQVNEESLWDTSQQQLMQLAQRSAQVLAQLAQATAK
jgi:flagellum-specific ATP synthase